LAPKKPWLARPNRAGNIPVDPSLNISPDVLDKGEKLYEDWHWGLKPQEVVDWDDTDMPPMLIQCGKLIRLHVRAPNSGRHPRRQRDAMIEFSRAASANCHIAYDPDHPHERLYLLVVPSARKALCQRFWHGNSAPPSSLAHLAHIAGGKHAKEDYPDVQAKPIGVLTAVVYFTHKKGDGPSYYIHHMGELSHHFPILVIDCEGRLWMAGGNYTTPVAGITN
jgi:hypothetical protein